MCGIVLVKWARVCACHIIHLHASKHTMRQWTMAPIKPSILIPYFAFLSLEMRDERTSHILPSLSCLRAPYTHLCPRRHSRHFISTFRLLFYFNCYVRASATHTQTHATWKTKWEKKRRKHHKRKHRKHWTYVKNVGQATKVKLIIFTFFLLSSSSQAHVFFLSRK